MIGDWKPVDYSGNIKVGDAVEFDVLNGGRFIKWRGVVKNEYDKGLGRKEYIIKRDEVSVEVEKVDSLRDELVRFNDHPMYRNSPFAKNKICYKVNSYEVELI